MNTRKRNRAKSTKTDRAKKDVVSYRRSCDVKGTGLSHYILMDRKSE